MNMKKIYAAVCAAMLVGLADAKAQEPDTTGVAGTTIENIDSLNVKDTISMKKLKTGKVEKAVVNGYQKVEDTTVAGYNAVENFFVKTYKKVENWFVDTFLEDK